MSLNAMILLNVLLDAAVVAGLAAVLIRPFVLERREHKVAPAAQPQELRRAQHDSQPIHRRRPRFTGESQTRGSTWTA